MRARSYDVGSIGSYAQGVKDYTKKKWFDGIDLVSFILAFWLSGAIVGFWFGLQIVA